MRELLLSVLRIYAALGYQGFLRGQDNQNRLKFNPSDLLIPIPAKAGIQSYNWVRVFTRGTGLADFYEMTGIILKIIGDELE